MTLVQFLPVPPDPPRGQPDLGRWVWGSLLPWREGAEDAKRQETGLG